VDKVKKITQNFGFHFYHLYFQLNIWRITPIDYVIVKLYFLYKSIFERQAVKTLKKLVCSDHIILDIGGGFGFYASKFCKYAQKGRVYLFEPYRINFLRCKRHVKEFFPNQIHFLELAISSSITNLPLIVDTRNPANNRIEKSLKEIDSRGLVETVETITIDEFCNSKKITPNLIKIDVQGHEMDCLRGAIRTINSKELQILMIEMDFDNFPDSCANIFTFLRSLEFKAFTMVNKKLAEIKSSNSMSGYHDFFYLKGISLEKLR